MSTRMLFLIALGLLLEPVTAGGPISPPVLFAAPLESGMILQHARQVRWNAELNGLAFLPGPRNAPHIPMSSTPAYLTAPDAVPPASEAVTWDQIPAAMSAGIPAGAAIYESLFSVDAPEPGLSMVVAGALLILAGRVRRHQKPKPNAEC
jgi:hypothetical protein